MLCRRHRTGRPHARLLANPNNGGQFWDGIAHNEKNAGQDCFPTGDLLYQVDSNGDGVKDNAKGLLIGDYNHNGVRDGVKTSSSSA